DLSGQEYVDIYAAAVKESAQQTNGQPVDTTKPASRLPHAAAG
ncbi:1-acyl-sn-glycerol-3-phosphate acyltransferase, partial [Microtetraspora sp. AC03309]|nr:1-acyl-sn-glycerol-3-phosphate acyltransferase [Microtetraspora sp. AC03309]